MKILLTALLPLLSPAGAFEDGQNAFRSLKEIHALAVEPIEFKYSASIAKLRSRARERDLLKRACTTFECAQNYSQQIEAIKTEIVTTDQLRREEIIKAERPFELEARKLLLGIYLFTLKEKLAANPEIRFLVDRGNSECGSHSSGRATYLPLSTPHVCQQVNLDFKQGEKFVRLSLAVGTVRKHFSWDGTFTPVRSTLGLGEVEQILNTPGWLDKYAGLEFLSSGSELHLSFYGNGRYMLGGTHDIGLVVLKREEL